MTEISAGLGHQAMVRGPLREGALLLLVGVDAQVVPLVKAMMAGRQGRSAILVLEHEGLKSCDFGCDVFSQQDLLPPGGGEASRLTADCDRAVRALSERLADVRIGAFEVAPDVVADAMQPARRVLEMARAARVLLDRGYQTVAVVLTGYLYVDGALLREATACGLADAGATALTPSEGALVPLPVLTAPSASSTPADWAALLKAMEPELDRHGDIFALGFAHGQRLEQLSAVTEVLASRGARVEHAGTPPLSGLPANARFVVVPELTVADPAAAADVLARLRDLWKQDLARREKSTGERASFGEHTLEAVEARLLDLEESIRPMLRTLARVERLSAICARTPSRGAVILDDPWACALAPSRPSSLECEELRTRLIRFPYAWSPADAEANTAMAQSLLDALREEREAHSIDGARMHVFVDVGAEDARHVGRWLSELPGQRAVLLMRHDPVAGCDFGCDRFHDLELIATNSREEEEVYRECHEHRVRRQSQLDTVTFRGVPLTLDYYRAAAGPLERMAILMRAAQMLYARCYLQVAIVFGTSSDLYGALALEAKACGVMPANASLKRVVGGEIVADRAWTTPSRTTAPSQWAQAMTHRTPVACAPSSVLVAAMSAEPAYVRNAKAVVSAIKARDASTLVVAPAIDMTVGLAGLELAVEELDPGAQIAARTPEEVAGAAGEFLGALASVAGADIGEVVGRSWRTLGRMTCVFQDLHATGRASTADKLLRHLSRVDRLDEILSVARPQIVYKFPSGVTLMDAALLGLARKYGLRQVASVYLSVSANYRDLDRTEQDVITALGEEQAEILRDNIVAQEVVPLGQPEMDAMVAAWPLERARMHAMKSMPLWDGDKKVVLVATSNFDPRGEPQWIAALARRAAARGDAHVLVKLHPSVPIATYRAKLEADIEVSLVGDPMIEPYMQIASVVVTDVSHAGKIAVYLGRPLMVVNISGTPFPYNHFDKDGVAIGAFSLPEVGPALDRLLEGREPLSGRADFIRRQFTSDDNRASERIADLVLSLRNK